MTITISEVKEAASKALSHPLLPRHAAQAIMGLIEVVQAQGQAIEAMQQRERPCKCSDPDEQARPFTLAGSPAEGHWGPDTLPASQAGLVNEELLQFPPIPSVEELQVSPGLTD